MRKETRKELVIGIICIVLYFVLAMFTKIPDMYLKILLFVGLLFDFIGLLPISAYNKLHIWIDKHYKNRK